MAIATVAGCGNVISAFSWSRAAVMATVAAAGNRSMVDADIGPVIGDVTIITTVE